VLHLVHCILGVDSGGRGNMARKGMPEWPRLTLRLTCANALWDPRLARLAYSLQGLGASDCKAWVT
jgi:hypothetical protein